MKKSEMLFDGPSTADTTIILAHGAGAPMDTPFMDFFAESLAEYGYFVARFEFPYMAARRTTDKKPGPDREPRLRQCWHDVIGLFKGRRLIGGKSMGGRMASLVADEAGVEGLVCLGYPFHPPGKPERLRTEHLEAIQTPTLILQGSRDSFGRPDEVDSYSLSSQIRMEWLEDGDHSLKPRKSSGRTARQNWQQGADLIAAFVAELD